MHEVKSMPKMYRQGDVLLVKVEELPKKARKSKTDIVLRGEATGHAHRLVDGTIYRFRGEITRGEAAGGSHVVTWLEQMFVTAKKGTSLVHDEHDPIQIEPGVYEVIRQREFDGVERDPRLVVD